METRRGASNEYRNVCFRGEIRKIPFQMKKKVPYIVSGVI